MINPKPDRALLEMLHNAIRYRKEKLAGKGAGSGDICKLLQNEGMIGSSQAMQQCLNLLPKAAH